MISFNSIKNISLLMFFLCGMFFLPNLVNAKIDVAGDTKKMLNDNAKGGWYTVNKTTLASDAIDISTNIPFVNLATIPLSAADVGDEKIWVNLFNSNPSNPKLTSEEFKALKEKLTADGSPLANKITEDNVYRENSSNVSTFVYDPTGGKTNDAFNIAYATKATAVGKGGNFYTAVIPAVKESADANEQLNIIDKAQGREAGTTIKEKSVLYNLQKEAPLLQQKVNEATKKVEDLKTNLNNIKSNVGSNAAQIALAEAALKEAEDQLRDTTQSRDVNNQKRAEWQNIVDSYNQPIDEGKCDPLNSISNCILWGVAITTNIVFKLASFGAYLAGTLFDYSLELSINSAELLKKLGVVEITWSFIRDILNMTFIFILLYTAVQILIGNDTKYNARKILTNVIVFAILMNFSLFAAKLMVDGSNIVSLKIYEAMKSNTDDKNSSISLRVMNTVGLAGLYNVSELFTAKTLQAEGVCAQNPTSLITVSVLGSVFLIILVLALGLAAILFLIRLVNIIYLFIRSPLWVWGYVIPGSQTMSKISSSWWSEMQHVLFFPIMYLFQIFIAVIVFDKLGSIQEDGTSLLKLICNPPTGSSGFGTSISLVVVFIIVIMFLMKAISYGVKHVGDGGEGAMGGKIGASVANKFAGYQTAMTKGLAKKAGGMSVGAANRGLAFAKDKTVGGVKRTSGLFAGGAAGMFNRDGIIKGAAEGFLNPGVYSKEQLATLAGKAAMLTGSQTLAAKATKLADESAKQRKEVYETRTKGEKTKEENLQKIAAKEYKIDTQEQWEKKNGEIGNDTAKADQYKEYIEKQVEKRANVSLGKNIITRNNKDGIKHLDAIRAKAVSQEVDAATGKIKIKINNRDIATGLGDVLKYHTTGDGVQDQAINKKGAWKPFRTKKAEARIKAAEAAFKAEESKYSGDQAEKDLAEMIKKTETKLAHMPEDKLIDEMVKDLGKPAITGDAEKASKEIRDFNKARAKYIQATTTNASATVLDDLKEKMEDKAEKLKSYKEKATKELVKRKEDLKRKEDKKAKENQ